jgi:hypothetical protein
MSENKALVKFNPETGFEFEDLDGMYRAAECYLQSGFAPKGFQSPQQLVICWARGAELGIRPLQAVDGMTVINNRLGIGGDLALALVRSKGMLAQSPKVSYVGQGDAYTCTVQLHRKGDDEPREYSFSVGEAKAARIYDRSDAWKGYPKRMTYYRALGFGLRDLFSDILKGMVTAEELHDYADIFEADKAKIEYNRAEESQAKAKGQRFVEPKAGSVRPTPAESVEPAFDSDKKPDMPPFVQQLEKEFQVEQETGRAPTEDTGMAEQVLRKDQEAQKTTKLPEEPVPTPDDLDMTAAPAPVPQPPAPSPSARPPWMDHVIRSIPHPRFAGKKISELDPRDLAKIESQWIPKIEADMDNANADQKLEYNLFQSAIAHSKMAKPF